MQTLQLRVRGAVQGVGFRPFVYRLANELELSGWVRNDSEGVLIELTGAGQLLEQFTRRLQAEAPAQARILDLEELGPAKQQAPGKQAPDKQAPDKQAPNKQHAAQHTFSILPSETGKATTQVLDDLALCEDCRQELIDQSNRRYRYPFINCTNCGPRFSIIQSIPYDRPNTSMSEFSMCTLCAEEYKDPNNRRFHAQPNACPECGPHIWLEKNGEKISPASNGDCLQQAVVLLREGYILAIKSIGGMRLACDATNDEAVKKLRDRKIRYHKPFALMAKNTQLMQAYVKLDEDSEHALKQASAPIVLLPVLPALKPAAAALSPAIAPKQHRLGFMLPATPLEYLLCNEIDVPLVMTSGNVSDEPQCMQNEEAREKLGNIADYLLLNNRGIVNRLDDSVLMAEHGIRTVRRARGISGNRFKLPPGFSARHSILAMGAELKNTFCLLQHNEATVSPHIGDLKNTQSWLDYQQKLDRLINLYQFEAQAIAVDKHKNYLSTRYGQKLSAEMQLPIVPVQHHHAHIAAVMGEHGVALGEKVMGVSMDGLGLGVSESGKEQLWGGEFLLAQYSGFKRVGGLQAIALPGGDQAMREPWRNLFAHLYRIGKLENYLEKYRHLPSMIALRSKPLEQISQLIDKGINSALASSCGRLFDAVAFAIGGADCVNTYEGQAAQELEALAGRAGRIKDFYPVDTTKVSGLMQISWERFWPVLFEDLNASVDASIIARKFHNTLIEVSASLTEELCLEHAVDTVVLSGGVFLNQILSEGLRRDLELRGLRVLQAQLLPPNDGGISFGQALIAASVLEQD